MRETPELLIPLLMIAVVGTLAWLGSTPIGGPIVGWVGQVVGPRWALVIGGLPTLFCGILALPALTRIDRRAAQGPQPAEVTGPVGPSGPAESAEEVQLTAQPR